MRGTPSTHEHRQKGDEFPMPDNIPIIELDEAEPPVTSTAVSTRTGAVEDSTEMGATRMPEQASETGNQEVASSTKNQQLEVDKSDVCLLSSSSNLACSNNDGEHVESARSDRTDLRRLESSSSDESKIHTLIPNHQQVLEGDKTKARRVVPTYVGSSDSKVFESGPSALGQKVEGNTLKQQVILSLSGSEYEGAAAGGLPVVQEAEVGVNAHAEGSVLHRKTMDNLINLIMDPDRGTRNAGNVTVELVDVECSAAGGKGLSQGDPISQGGETEALVLSSSRQQQDTSGVDFQVVEKPGNSGEYIMEASCGTSARGLSPIETGIEGAEKARTEGPSNLVSPRVTATSSSHNVLTPVIEAKAAVSPASRSVDDNIDLASRVDPVTLEGVSQSSSDENTKEEDTLEDEDDQVESEDSYHTSELSLKEEDIEELTEQLLEAESEAASIQESLEEESLFRVRGEVAAELAETLGEDKLESAVEEEMTTYIEQCEDMLEEIEERSALLQEKLEDAGVSLTHLFKWIEKQTPEGCTTEAWKKRTLWVGHQPSEEVVTVLNNASEELKLKHPARSHRGKILDEGASGFLERKLAAVAHDIAAEGASKRELSDDDGWSKIEEFLDNDESAGPGQLMGTKRWAAVYLASTPEQAAQLGLTLPGVDTVEEIGDIETENRAIFKAALKNERERGLTEGQKSLIKKVREEDDLKKIRRRQRRSRQRSWKSKQINTDLSSPIEKEEPPPGQSIENSCRAPSEAVNVHVVESTLVLTEYVAQPGIVPGTKETSRKWRPTWKSEELSDVIDLLSDDDSDRGELETGGKQQGAAGSEPAGSESVHRENPNVALIVKVEPSGNVSLPQGFNISEFARGEQVDVPTTAVTDLSIVVWKAGSTVEGEFQGSSNMSQTFPDQGISKKRTFQGPSGNAEEEYSRKKQRTGEDGGEKVSSPGGSRSGLKQPAPGDTSNKNYLVRTTVVIDSDGEREVEEALTETPTCFDLPNGQVTSLFKERVLTVTDECLGHQDTPRSLGDGVLVQQELHRVDPLQAQLNGRKRKARLDSDTRVRCTSCGQMMKVYEVLSHPNPKLPVAVCRTCTNHYLSGPFRKDEDGSDSECSWCGEGGEVVCCTRCDKVFCRTCIKRNYGRQELIRVLADDYWLCFFCNNLPLAHLTKDLERAVLELNRLLSGERQAVHGDMDEPTRQEEAFIRNPKRGRHRKNIRKILSDDELEEKQKELLIREKERQERLERWQSVSAVAPHQLASREVSQSEQAGYDNLPKATVIGLPINADRDPDEEPIFIAPGLAEVLKPHQFLAESKCGSLTYEFEVGTLLFKWKWPGGLASIDTLPLPFKNFRENADIEGVRFMWQNCMDSVKKVRNDPNGLGCILAHSMGLGKTLQVITFLHTVLTSDLLWFKTALIVVPVNVLHNWKREFEMWQESLGNPVSVYILDDSIRENFRRAQLLSSWHNGGGVMIMGYSAFRNLSVGKHVKDKVTRDSLCQSLQNPGPDILVCDEAHMIKNAKADITQVLKQVRSKRRVALTGSPLQNNLMEYYCMVDFVREGFLGTPAEFKNRFQNPIENGQHGDSTAEDVKIMKYRASFLNKTLKWFVQRIDSSVLKDQIPPKVVYVISVRLSQLQRRLYEHYLETHGGMQEDDGPPENKTHRPLLFNAFHTLSKIWNHPDLLFLAQQEKLRKQQEDSLDEFAFESDDEKLSDPEAVAASTSLAGEGKWKAGTGSRSFKKKGSNDPDELENSLWWKDIMDGSSREDVNLSGKMVLLLELLSMSAARGDKILVFSQSLGTLDLIEKFMETKLFIPSEGRYWEQNKHWYRLDGSTPAGVRMSICERFNNPDNTDVKCVLISTRAGSLGINLPAANRVIIVDGSWNPVHDLQALFRAWRLGQKKRVFAYRLLACGTMEEKIYNRQVAKEGVAARVLDKSYPERIFNGDDLEFLFRLEPDGDDYVSRESDGPLSVPGKTPSEHASTSASGGLVSMGSASRNKLSAFHVPDDEPPVDDVMGKLLLDHRPRWVVSYHEHEPLLEHKEDEGLFADESSISWETIVGNHLAFRSVQNLQNPVTAIALPYLQATHVDEVPMVHSLPAISTRPLCSSKDHAALLSEFQVQVSEQILCNSCNLHISWKDISTGPKQFFRGS